MSSRAIRVYSALLFTCRTDGDIADRRAGGQRWYCRVKSAYSIGETIERLKKDIADKGIKFFNEIDQSKLAAMPGSS